MNIFIRLISLYTGYFDKKIFIIGALFLLLLLCSLLSMIVGSFAIPVFEIIRIISSHLILYNNPEGIVRLHDTIIWNLRAPRILLAIFVGVALSCSGSVFQGCFRNPLVDPFILGVSSGAAFGASLGIIFPFISLSVQILAFIFGSLAVIIAYSLSRTNGEVPTIVLILAGVIVGSLFDALVSILKYTASDAALRGIVFWLMGGFYFASWNDVILLVPLVVICFLLIYMKAWQLNILTIGEEEAKTLGVNPEKLKYFFIGLATFITALSVSMVGIIAWIGLMMPHAARMLVGPDHRYTLVTSGLLGGIYLLICDTLARTLTSSEIPVGIITSIIGAPYLFYLIKTRGREIFL